jgi:integrase
MVALQRASGMRPQEVVAIRAVDLDMTDPTCWAYRPGAHKTEHHGQDRVIFLGPRAIEILRPFLRLDIGGFLFSPIRAESEHQEARRAGRQTPLWESHVAHQAKERAKRGRKPRGDRYDVASYRRAIARACNRAFPHPTLSAIARKHLDDAQRAELEAWRKAHRWHPHRLRHSAATAIRKRFGIEGSQAVLGQKELSSAQVYAEKDLEAARMIMREIG